MEIHGLNLTSTRDRLIADAKAYCDSSPAAVAAMEERLGRAARHGNQVLTWTQLARGLTLVLPSTQEQVIVDAAGAPSSPALRAVDQIAMYLGWVSFQHAGVLVNALVVDEHKQPTAGFLRLAQLTGKFAGHHRDEDVLFQAAEARRVYAWFKQL
jgi:hypothetical protein